MSVSVSEARIAVHSFAVWSMLTSMTSRCCQPLYKSSREHETLELSSIAGWHYWLTSQRSGYYQLRHFARSSSRWRWKLQEPQLRRLFPASWIIRCSTGCRTLYCTSCSLCRMPLHDWSLACDAVIISRYPSESVPSSKWHAWFASHLSTWLMTAVSSPTALGTLCAQLTFRLAWFYAIKQLALNYAGKHFAFVRCMHCVWLETTLNITAALCPRWWRRVWVHCAGGVGGIVCSALLPCCQSSEGVQEVTELPFVAVIKCFDAVGWVAGRASGL